MRLMLYDTCAVLVNLADFVEHTQPLMRQRVCKAGAYQMCVMLDTVSTSG